MTQRFVWHCRLAKNHTDAKWRLPSLWTFFFSWQVETKVSPFCEPGETSVVTIAVCAVFVFLSLKAQCEVSEQKLFSVLYCLWILTISKKRAQKILHIKLSLFCFYILKAEHQTCHFQSNFCNTEGKQFNLLLVCTQWEGATDKARAFQTAPLPLPFHAMWCSSALLHPICQDPCWVDEGRGSYFFCTLALRSSVPMFLVWKK